MNALTIPSLSIQKARTGIVLSARAVMDISEHHTLIRKIHCLYIPVTELLKKHKQSSRWKRKDKDSCDSRRKRQTKGERKSEKKT